MSLFATGFAMPATTQALVDAEVLRISATVARRMGTGDLRVARHLLDLASARVREQPASDHLGGRELTVQVSQQELADAVGTVREVVVRVLRELRRDGVVRTERDRIVLLEPARLIQEQGVEPRFLTSPARASTLRPMTRGRPRDHGHRLCGGGSRVGQSWCEQRWDSLRLNNPGGMNPMLASRRPTPSSPPVDPGHQRRGPAHPQRRGRQRR
jgi:hypothetical protein